MTTARDEEVLATKRQTRLQLPDRHRTRSTIVELLASDMAEKGDTADATGQGAKASFLRASTKLNTAGTVADSLRSLHEAIRAWRGP
jgi:hypothetical protein